MTAVAATAAEACLECVGLCETCPVDSGADWPPLSRDDAADSEAGGLAYAGADHPRPETVVAATWERHYSWRTVYRNRARYGDGGLFDHLEESA